MKAMKMPKKIESEDDKYQAISAYMYREVFRHMRKHPKSLFQFFQNGLTQEFVD